MRFLFVVLLFSLTLVTVREVEAACNAQITFDACIERGKQYFSLCSETDWTCKCQRQKDMMNCYTLCLEDPVIQAQAEIQKTVVSANCIQVTTSVSTKPPTATSAMSNQPAPTGTPSTTNSSVPSDVAQNAPWFNGFWLMAMAGLWLGCTQ